MGIENHNAVIATTWCDEKADDLREWLNNLDVYERKLFASAGSWCNGYRTFIMVPDGSNEGWEESNKGNLLREKFINFLKNTGHWDWIEVGFGEFGQKVLQGNNKNMYSDKEYAE